MGFTSNDCHKLVFPVSNIKGNTISNCALKCQNESKEQNTGTLEVNLLQSEKFLIFKIGGRGSFTSHSIANDREITSVLPGTLAFSAFGTVHTLTQLL